MKHITISILCLVILAVSALHAHALNIVLTNDDGYATPNIQALYAALKAQGHDVIMSAPAENQSGTSASMDWFANVNTSVDPDDSDIHLVEGTPAMAVLCGGPQSLNRFDAEISSEFF